MLGSGADFRHAAENLLRQGTSYLYTKQVKIFDYPKFAEPFRDRLRGNAERLAATAGIEIEFIGKRNVRKEDLVKAALAKRGEHPGLVCILSAMEPCSTYKPWHDKATGKTFLRFDDGKCLHYYFYYFYFNDEEVGLCYVRVPTWLPCRLQIYCNWHNWLASKLRRQNITCTLMDNAFAEIADWNRAQQLANGLEIKRLHGKVDQYARTYCPIHGDFGVQYHWSVDQAHDGAGILEALRQVQSDSKDRDHGQRSYFFQALPRGRTSRRHQRNQVGAYAKALLSRLAG